MPPYEAKYPKPPLGYLACRADGCNEISSLLSELTISTNHCFTDSRVTLCWIRNTEKSWRQFVQNRVSEIQNLFDVECWKHIPGVDNLADIPSCGVTPLELLVSKLWQDGPDVPLVPPVEQPDADIPSEYLEELRASEKQAVHGLLTGGQTKPCLENLIADKNFSSLNRLIGVLTCVLKFCSCIPQKMGSTAFSGNERKFAEMLLIIKAQVFLRDHKNFSMECVL